MDATLPIALATGFLGGFGHCVAMCGPLVGALGLSAPPGIPVRRALAPQLAYHLGRITTYGTVGAAMGLAGSFVNVAGRMAGLQDAVAVAAGVLLVAMGLGAASRWRLLRDAEGRVAGRVMRAVRSLAGHEAPARAYPLGLLLGLLPCGLSYSAFAAAAATGSPVRGLLLALAFGAGTLPALLAAGAIVGALPARGRGLLQRAGGLLVAAMGVVFVLRGLRVHVPHL
ncbi:MAG TPA: sulfite exporter TauE/SafE family protein [Anaeromyxobacteraceae bacterium]|nr:sulfite exporter TauE/SafE family protein [Anaeromyxobacteraceae bacterium]